MDATKKLIAAQYAGKPCTLNGQPAKIMGAMNDHATVATLDPTGSKVEFAWKTVENIMKNKNGEFKDI